MLGLAEARRRRNRWRYLSAAAAVVVLAAGLFSGLKSATSTTTTQVVPNQTMSWDTAQGTNHVTGATADIAYTQQLWGNAFQVLVNHIPQGTTCQMWVIHPDGTRTQVAAWTTAPDEGTVWYWGSMPRTAGSIGKFQITAGNKVLLTVTPD